jgi:predicted phage terminase large subunit-like protein
MTPEVAAQTWKCFAHTYAEHVTSKAPLEQRWIAHKHLRLVSIRVQAMLASGKGGVLLVSMPPRHGKSELISRWLPEQYLALNPHKRVMLLSYSAELCEEFSRRVRNGLIQHGGRVASDKASVSWWDTPEGGGMTAAGIGGSIVGKGADLIIIDDPVKNAEEADSETIRAKHKAGFGSDVWTRRQKGCVIVVLMTRWHTDDLYAHIKSVAPDCEEIKIRGICEDANDPLGRHIGQALCPDLVTLDMLKDAQRVLTARQWNALFRQEPADEEGAEIKRAWWRRYDELPVEPGAMDLRALSVDATFRDSDGSDYVVIQAWGVYGTRRYLLGQVRERMGFVETVRAILTMRETHRPNVIVIEAKANGDAIIEQLQREGVAELVAITPKASKVARARAASPQIEAGNVWLPKTKDADMLIEEAASFPLGKHDDMVDACSQLLNYLGDMRSAPKSDLQPGDSRWVSPDVARERRNDDGWRSVFQRVKRVV